MQTPDTNTNAFPVPAPVVGPSKPCSPEDDFYDKLTRFYETSGLSLIVMPDVASEFDPSCHNQALDALAVTKDGRWDEVASSLNAESSVLVPPTQIQMLYTNLFYQFEQTYYYRSPSKVKEAQLLKAALIGQSVSTGKKPGGSTKKRKHNESNDCGLVDKRVSVHSPVQLPTGMEYVTLGKRLQPCYTLIVVYVVVFQTCERSEVKSMERNPLLQVLSEETGLVLKTPTKGKETKKSYLKEMKKHSDAPMGLRTGYMIFLKMECERLKILHGEDSAGQYRDMANEAWRNLSDSAREPYIEASRRDKERYTREMAEFKIVYDQIIENQNLSTTTNSDAVVDFAKPSLPTDGDYHVTLPDDAYHVTLPPDAGDNVVTNEELAAEIMQKSTSTDPEFQLNWDGYT
ncbi:hypothetical protein AgCh_021750 [Apium graveolens]